MTPRVLARLEEVVCRRKTALGRHAAMSLATRAREAGATLSAYRCPFSDPEHWHVGHAPSMRTLGQIAEVLRDRSQYPLHSGPGSCTVVQ